MTGYVVHYSDGVTNMTHGVPASSTSLIITGLSSGLSYTFSVEATSKHLSAESASCTISMGNHLKWCVNLLTPFLTQVLLIM